MQNKSLRNIQPGRRARFGAVSILTITKWWQEGSRDQASKGKRFSIEGLTTVDDFNFCVRLAREFGYHLAFERHTATFSRPILRPATKPIRS
jgi:hypothetical protein